MILRLVLMAATAASVVLSAAPASAQSAFVGIWSVLVISETGICDRAYRYPVRIRNGQVTHADPTNSSFTIAGRVQRNGSIKVSVSRGAQRADGSGRLSRKAGAGQWASSKGECAGLWTTERRG